jgi:hypothetical protein
VYSSADDSSEDPLLVDMAVLVRAKSGEGGKDVPQMTREKKKKLTEKR